MLLGKPFLNFLDSVIHMIAFFILSVLMVPNSLESILYSPVAVSLLVLFK